MEIKAKLNKPYTDSQRLDFIVEQNHQKGYEIKETPEALEAWGKDDSELLELAKATKIAQNDETRDITLNEGVRYKDVLFDSDTDQKINLLATIGSMSEEATVVWFGMDNTPLVCTKEDLENIGTLIIQLHTFCWTKNAEIKAEISYAQTMEELDAIQIDYRIPEPEETVEEAEEQESEDELQ